MRRTIIIAEAGVNHNGSIEMAKQLIDAAAIAKVDYVKFQTFRAEKLVSKNTKKAAYQIKATGTEESQFEMIKKLELNKKTHQILLKYCKEKKVKFLSTAFDIESIDLLVELGVDLMKIPSGEITNLPYLKKIASTNKPIVLSTGMSSLGEIEAALRVLFENGVERKNVIVLHCNTEYPTPMRDVNLRAMNTIEKAFNVKVGYSDHTLGIEIPIAAVAMGAVCIEKHFTLNREMKGPDHHASIEPNELKVMVDSIRNIEIALGDGIKAPSMSEKKNIAVARKSIHIARDLLAGHILVESDLAMKRPGDGISPMDIGKIIGCQVVKDLYQDDKLTLKDIV